MTCWPTSGVEGLLQADQDLVGSAEGLHRDILEAGGLQGLAHGIERRRCVIADFNQRAASEVEAQAQLLHRQRHQGDQQQHRRGREGQAALAHEIELSHR